jgi:8-oxo-dGTP pyrophosphatase MutT (NUDIX family)
VVAGLLVQGATVLLCRRSPTRRWYPGVWDLPGGHIEVSETPAVALCRELREELDIAVDHSLIGPWRSVHADDFEMEVAVVPQWTGTPRNAAPEEHDALDWYSLPDAAALDLAHPSYPSIFSWALGRGPDPLPSRRPPPRGR